MQITCAVVACLAPGRTRGRRRSALDHRCDIVSTMRKSQCDGYPRYGVVVVLAIACFLAYPLKTACEPNTSPGKRLVALPDLHGDLRFTKQSLKLASISTDGESWTAGSETTLVQTGDIVDRGEHSIDIIKLFMKLKEDSMESDGARVGSSNGTSKQPVTVLLGNHELMQLQHDFRYVAREEISKLGKESLEAKNLGGQEMGTGYGLRAYWQAGQMAWKKTFSPGESIGDEVRGNRPLLHVAGDGACATLFAHAGVRLNHLEKHGNSVEGVNQAATEAIAKVSDFKTPEKQSYFLATHNLFDNDSPVWNRFWSGTWDGAMEGNACDELDAILKLTNANRMVIGHTIQLSGMTTRCGGKLHLIDVGISSAYLGNAAAWTCEGGVVRAHYDGRVEVLEEATTESREDSVDSHKSHTGVTSNDDDDANKRLNKNSKSESKVSAKRRWFDRLGNNKIVVDRGKGEL